MSRASSIEINFVGTKSGAAAAPPAPSIDDATTNASLVFITDLA
jgi:hypothetical protein